MPGDLVLLVADKNIDHGLKALLTRPQSLSIRNITLETYVHPRRDPGCARDAHSFLRPLVNEFAHALVVFDHEGSGFEDRTSGQLSAEVSARVATDWGNRAEVIVLEPELENWVFADSPHVEDCLGWKREMPLRVWLKKQGLWIEGEAKPRHPKDAMEAALRITRRPRSSAIYDCLGRKVNTRHCKDLAFLKFKRVLGEWFPR